MKKLLLLFFFSVSIFSVSAQYVFPNFSFEDWTNGDPDYWYTDNAPSLNVYPITPSVDAHSGNFAVKGEVLNYNTWTAPNFGSPGSTLFEVTEQYPTINFYYKYNKVNNDVVIFSSVIYTASNYPMAFGDSTFGAPVSSYTPMGIPITYLFPDSTPARMAIIMGIEDTATSTASPGSYFLIDDISLGWFTALEVEENVFAEENVKVFSNPATDFISFSVPEKNPNNTISVFDITGKQMIKPFVSKSSRTDIHATELADGIYFLNIQNGENLRVKKIAVKH